MRSDTGSGRDKNKKKRSRKSIRFEFEFTLNVADEGLTSADRQDGPSDKSAFIIVAAKGFSYFVTLCDVYNPFTRASTPYESSKLIFTEFCTFYFAFFKFADKFSSVQVISR